MEALGPGWRARGTASVKLVNPVHDGEELTVAGAGPSARAVAHIRHTVIYHLPAIG